MSTTSMSRQTRAYLRLNFQNQRKIESGYYWVNIKVRIPNDEIVNSFQL